MVLADLAIFCQYAMLTWLSAFFVVIVVQMMRGRINTAGLLASSSYRKNAVDPERVAVFAASLFAIAAYALEVLSVGPVFDPDTLTYSMPAPPETLLVLFGAVNGVYLSGKLIRPIN
jgi:hypothetical protein